MTTDKQIQEARLLLLKRLADFNYPKWVNEKNNQYGLNLNFSSVAHVAKLLADLTMAYAGSLDRLNPFLMAVYKEELIGAFTCADVINIQAMAIYADFVYNIIPASLRIKK